MWSQIASHLHQIGYSFFLPLVAKKGRAVLNRNFNFQLKNLTMKNDLIKFRVSKIENLIIKKKAEDSGVTVSELMRGLVFDYKLSHKLTTEEIECYLLLSKYADNFRRISNLFKLGDVDGFKKETLDASKQIREHLIKFK
jgi:hypothetical protein